MENEKKEEVVVEVEKNKELEIPLLEVEKKPEETNKPKTPQPKLREIIITTDGSIATITKNESSGTIELAAILSGILQALSEQK